MYTRIIDTILGRMILPGEPEQRSRQSEECAREVLDGQIYSYERTQMDRSTEIVRSVVDIGCNIGAFIRFARLWWPTLEKVTAYDPNASACELARANTDPGLDVEIIAKAVTIDPCPLFNEAIDWGSSRTYGQSEGVTVPAIHPRDLPACDCLKVDAEGVEAEIFGHYQHFAAVKVVCVEYHEDRFRRLIMSTLDRAGLVMRRGNPEPNTPVDTQVWVRPNA